MQSSFQRSSESRNSFPLEGKLKVAVLAARNTQHIEPLQSLMNITNGWHHYSAGRNRASDGRNIYGGGCEPLLFPCLDLPLRQASVWILLNEMCSLRCTRQRACRGSTRQFLVCCFRYPKHSFGCFFASSCYVSSPYSYLQSILIDKDEKACYASASMSHKFHPGTARSVLLLENIIQILISHRSSVRQTPVPAKQTPVNNSHSPTCALQANRALKTVKVLSVSQLIWFKRNRTRLSGLAILPFQIQNSFWV